MNFIRKTIFIGLLLGVAPVLATDGYFMIGYGAKSIGIGGAGVAYPQDRLIAASNPAGISKVADGIDVGARILFAIRDARIDCRGIGACDTVVQDRSQRDLFLVPNFGWRRGISDDIAVGVAMYANGGINTTYGKAFYDEAAARIQGLRPGDPGFPGRGKLGLDFSQLFFAPTVSWQFYPDHSIGLSPLASIQRFSARGLESFAAISSDSTSLTGRTTDYTFGGGFRVGWLGQVHERISMGAQYTSRIWTGEATGYNGLLAENGDHDAPPHWSVGVALNMTPRLEMVFDYQQILWGDIEALANPGPTQAELLGVITGDRLLGGSNGIGFGWIDQSVFKLGFVFQLNEAIILRSGWNHASSQIPNRETLINIVAPATVNDHLTVGASWKTARFGEFTCAYMATFKTTNRDRDSEFFGSTVHGSIYEHGLDLSWARDF